MYRFFPLLFLCAMLGAVSPPVNAASGVLTLVSGSVTPQILIDPQASPSERFAADELSLYLEKITAKKIAVQAASDTGTIPPGTPLIVIGHHPFNRDLEPEKLGIEDSLLSVEPNRVRIVGGAQPPLTVTSGSSAKPVRTVYARDRGTLFGVYSFLDMLGVRWYRPEPWGEYVPVKTTIDLRLGKTFFKPAYKYRYGLGNYQDKKAQTPEQIEWMNLWVARNRMGVSDPKFGGAYRTAFHHNYMYLVPHEKYFKEHPEYFALIDGVRSTNPRAQLCLGNRDVQELVASAIIEQAKQNPQQAIFSIDPNDRSYWCECELCRAMDDPALLTPTGKVSMANRVALFGNIIARKLAAAHLQSKVGWRAYSLYTETPTRTKLEPNTAIEATAFAGAYSDYSRDLLDPSSKQNAAFARVLKGYGPLTELLVHDYYSGYAWYGPLPVLHTMKDRFDQYRKFGVVGVSSEMHPSWGPQGIAHYFYARLLWNPDVDMEKELADYCRNYYGPAGDAMLRYHRLLDEAAQKGPRFGSGGSYLAALFDDGLIGRMTCLMDEARATVKSQPLYERRLQGDWAGYEVARLINLARRHKRHYRTAEAAQVIEDLKKFILSFPNGEVFDNSPVIFRYVTLTMLATSNLDNLQAQDDLLSRDYREAALVQNLDEGWRLQSDASKDGLRRGVANANFKDDQWQAGNVLKPWQEQGFPDFQGALWYRKSLALKPIAANQRLLLSFGAADGDAKIYLNGVLVGQHLLGEDSAGWNQPFLVDITKAARKIPAGDPIVLAVEVAKNSGNGGLYQGVDLWTALPKNAAANDDWQDY